MDARQVGASMAKTLDKVSRNIATATRDVAKDAAQVAREELEAAARSSTAGGDGRISGFGPAGRLRTKAKYDPQGVTILPVGVWKVAEEGVAAHYQPKRKAHHPGTKQGNLAWSRGRDAALARLEKSVPKTIEKAVEEGFRG